MLQIWSRLLDEMCTDKFSSTPHVRVAQGATCWKLLTDGWTDVARCSLSVVAHKNAANKVNTNAQPALAHIAKNGTPSGRTLAGIGRGGTGRSSPVQLNNICPKPAVEFQMTSLPSPLVNPVQAVPCWKAGFGAPLCTSSYAGHEEPRNFPPTLLS